MLTAGFDDRVRVHAAGGRGDFRTHAGDSSRIFDNAVANLPFNFYRTAFDVLRGLDQPAELGIGEREPYLQLAGIDQVGNLVVAKAGELLAQIRIHAAQHTIEGSHEPRLRQIARSPAHRNLALLDECLLLDYRKACVIQELLRDIILGEQLLRSVQVSTQLFQFCARLSQQRFLLGEIGLIVEGVDLDEQIALSDHSSLEEAGPDFDDQTRDQRPQFASAACNHLPEKCQDRLHRREARFDYRDRPDALWLLDRRQTGTSRHQNGDHQHRRSDNRNG